MKCENCGKNEVSFVYQSNINGKREEKHLCADCARKLGYADGILAQQRRMMRGMESLFDDSFFGGSLLGDFFGERTALNGRRNRFFGEDLFDDFFREMPALGSGTPEETPKAEEKTVSEEESGHFAQIRQRNALRHELKKASVESKPATTESEAEYVTRITVSMAQRTYAEEQMDNLRDTVDTLVLDALGGEE